ncbi:MAG: DNA polymerase III subunit delta [Gammaproteobacteria bacterium]|nr:DNA polymerase III subunit delta [Gammaproteobacteria bacterium]
MAPVYLLAGDEPLQQTEALDLLRRRAREAGFAERVVLDTGASGFDWRELGSASASLSLFAERRLFELRLGNGSIGKEGADALVAYAGSPPEDVLLVATCGVFDGKLKKARWVKAIDQVGAVVECRVPRVEALPGWIDRRMRARGMQPSREAVDLLADRVEGNLVAAAQEIDKLLLLNGTGAVDIDTVLRSVTDSARFSVYDLVDATLAAQLARALRVLDGLRGEGTHPTLVLWALAREVRALCSMARDAAGGAPVARVLDAHRVWPWRKRLVGDALRRSGYGHWSDGLAGCARADRVIKGRERGDAWRALRELVTRLAGGPELVPR